MSKNNKKCFIIMPITTPSEMADKYKGDNDHFDHVLEHLFIPALSDAGFDAIPPKTSGSNIIQAEIIKNLSEADLVLCDMSILNPNVFFEFGIRTALDKPVALVADDITKKIPFDTSMINFHQYDSSLEPWHLSKDVKSLSEHVKTTYENNSTKNSLWKYFGVAQTGEFKPGESTVEDKIELIMKEISALREEKKDNIDWIGNSTTGFRSMPIDPFDNVVNSIQDYKYDLMKKIKDSKKDKGLD